MLWMVFVVNYLIVIVFGMGMNVYFVVLVVGLNGSIDYVIVFLVVFVVGIIFIILLLILFCEKLIEVILNNLKYVISVGIGLFIVFIGFCLVGIIVVNKLNLIGFGDLQFEKVVLILIGFVIIIILYMLNVNGVLFFGMIIMGLIVFFRGQFLFDKGLFVFFYFSDGLMILNFFVVFGDVIYYDLYIVVFFFLFVIIFDIIGIMVGVV